VKEDDDDEAKSKGGNGGTDDRGQDLSFQRTMIRKWRKKGGVLSIYMV
jgi:hypothetical protein